MTRIVHSIFIIAILILASNGNDIQHSIGVTVEQLQKLMKTQKVTIIDVREPWELIVEGKISGSINIPGWQLKDALSISTKMFMQYYGIPLPEKGDCNLIFHCKSGGRSLKAVTLARQMGWYCSRHLLGGFTAWKEFFSK